MPKQQLTNDTEKQIESSPFDSLDLRERFRVGERAALDQVYRHYVADLANFLRHGFTFSSGGRPFGFSGYHQPFDLDSALQETFARAFQPSARHAFDPQLSYRNYLLAIARNFVLDECRRREIPMDAEMQSRLGAESRPPAFSPNSIAASPEEDALDREVAGLYSRFVGTLSPSDRLLFECRFEAERTQLECAHETGLSQMQVRTREDKLRRQFLSFMQEKGYLTQSTKKPARMRRRATCRLALALGQ